MVDFVSECLTLLEVPEKQRRKMGYDPWEEYITKFPGGTTGEFYSILSFLCIKNCAQKDIFIKSLKVKGLVVVDLAFNFCYIFCDE